MSTDTRQNLTPETALLARSGSFFGAIRNIVTAPFTWLAGSEDDFEDTKRKRRMLPVISEESGIEDEGFQSRAKRMRVGSPDRDTRPYLDPPRSAFAQPRRTSGQFSSSAVRDSSRSPRKTLHIPRASSTSNQLPRNRRTVSPASGSHLKPQGLTRTMSLDPPSLSSFSSRIQAVPAIQNLQPESNHMGEEMPVSRDVSTSPRRLRVRSSLTPQPSGPSFGPVIPPRRERGPDEPPPLTALMSNPTFVKPPPGSQKQNAAELQKQLTLGSLVDQRRARTPARQSSILFGTGSMTDVSARHLWPANKAEVALHELEVYKTPLLPTRLKGSSTIPNMFVHKEKKPITLMDDDRPSKPRLGMKDGRKDKGKGKGKKKDREAMNGTKPYAGEGGMKKWLAKRKKEEEEAKEKEEDDAMEDEKAEEERKRKEAEAEKKKREEGLRIPPPPPSAPVFEPRVAREGPLTSSLRVGRARTGRNHLERPVHRTKFSAAFEDDDDEMEESRATEQKVLEEAAQKVPVFEIPAGFTFAKEATVTHGLTQAKEPPISSLPFSLTKPTPAPAPAPRTAPTPIPVLPTISLIPPTPETAKIYSEPPTAPAVPAASSAATLAPPTTTPSGIPNFFASASVFAKPVTLPTPPALSLSPPTEENPRPAAILEMPAKALEAPPAPKAPSLFGAPSQPVSVFGAPASATPSIFGAPPAPPKEAEKPATSVSTLGPAFTFGAPVKPVEPAPAPALSQSPAPSQTAEHSKTAAPSASPFAFNSPAPVPAPAPAAPSIASGAPKSVFTFGQPASAATTAPTGTPAPAPAAASVAAEPPKSLFGTQPPSTPFTFGPRPSTAPAEEKPASSPFSFNTPSAAEKRPSTGFSFGAPSTPTAAPAPPAVTTPTPFSFGTPSGTAAADVSSKPFAFGAAPPARPATPPKVEQEVMMDESPARDMILNGNGKAPERPTLNFSFITPSTSGSALFAQSPATTAAPFSFGSAGTAVNPFAKEENKETKPAVSFSGFGQTTSTGFGFGQKPPESPATTAAAFQFPQASPSVAPASPFTFGPAAPATAPFGQASTASTPSSPSAFNRPTPFGFGTPATTQPAAASPFSFGASSQPASPATANTTLPTATTGSSFTFGAGTTGAAAPAAPTPFGAPAPAGGAGTLFTIGSAPPVDGRRIKGLPRRGGRR